MGRWNPCVMCNGAEDFPERFLAGEDVGLDPRKALWSLCYRHREVVEQACDRYMFDLPAPDAMRGAPSQKPKPGRPVRPDVLASVVHEYSHLEWVISYMPPPEWSPNRRRLEEKLRQTMKEIKAMRYANESWEWLQKWGNREST